jgi:V8-like Glu-specific endopeptidase
MKINQFWTKSINAILTTVLLVLFANLQVWAQTPLNDLVENVNFKFDSKSRTTGNTWKDIELPSNAIYGRFIISKANLGEHSKVIFTSFKDGQQQVLTGGQLREWGNSSAYFNGNKLSVQVIQDPRDKGHIFLEMDQMIVGYPVPGVKSQCGSTDNRVPSNDAAIGRIVPVGCTGWLITNGKMVTAGHCTGSRAQILEFNVPASNSNGSIVHPPVKDQYPILASSLQTDYPSYDWAVYNLGTNSQTGLSALAAQGKSFNVVQTGTASSVRITGFGVEKTSNNPYNPTRNQTQQTHVGPFSSSTSTKLYYAADTEGGNSGSPVIDEATGNAIGVHTHGGCSTSGGNNSGTNAKLASFWNAMGLGGGGTPSAYCASKGNNATEEYISRVRFGSINNASGNGNGYSDHTAIATSINKGASATITITPTWTGTVYREGYSVWIDFNQDGDFNDSGEQVFTRSATTSTSISGTITIPSSAASGATRMRVSMKYNGIPSSCETFSYGEVEDYTINIGGSRSATESLDNNNEVVVYPTVAKAGQNINLRSNEVGQVYTVISATLGSVVMKGEVQDSNVKINTATLGKGLYILRIGKSTHKFLID